MTSNPEPQPPRPDASRELVGLALLIVGVLVVGVTLWLVHPLAFTGTVGAAAVAAGLWLATGKVE